MTSGGFRRILARKTIGRRNLSIVPIEDQLFGVSDEQSAIRENFRNFFESELTQQRCREIDETDSFPEYREFWLKCGEQGVLGTLSAEEFGGTGMGLFETSLMLEELSRISGGVYMGIFAHTCLSSYVIERNGTAEQKAKFLPGLVSGQTIGALAMSEPGSGSDVMSMRCQAVKEAGKDYYVVNGTKFWITNGPICDTLVLYARTDPTSKGSKSITAFAIDVRELEGFTATPIPGKMGVRGSYTGELHFDNVKIPASAVLGAEGKGAAVLMKGLNVERLTGAAGAVGYMQAACDCAFPYAHERKQFGVPIGEFQMMQSKMAEMYAQLSATRAYLYALLKAADKDQKTLTNHDCAAVLMYGAEQATKVSLEAIQILGGNGYTNAYPAERIMRDCKIGEIGAGTTEVRKLILGRHFNALYKNN